MLSNPYVMGLIIGASAYGLVEWLKPSLIYKDDKTTLQNDMISPITVGALAGILGVYIAKQQSQDLLAMDPNFGRL